MSQQALYVQYRVTPKRTLTRATGNETVTIELPAKHVVDWKYQQPDRYLTDEEIAIELTEAVANCDSRQICRVNSPAHKGAGNPLGQAPIAAFFYYERTRLRL